LFLIDPTRGGFFPFPSAIFSGVFGNTATSWFFCSGIFHVLVALNPPLLPHHTPTKNTRWFALFYGFFFFFFPLELAGWLSVLIYVVSGGTIVRFCGACALVLAILGFFFFIFFFFWVLWFADASGDFFFVIPFF